MPKITMDGKYTTWEGDPVRVLCIDAPGGRPVVAIDDRGVTYCAMADGRQLSDKESVFDLFPVEPTEAEMAIKELMKAVGELIEDYDFPHIEDAYIHAKAAGVGEDKP